MPLKKALKVIDGLKQAMELGLNIVVIATGGILIEMARGHGLPYVQMSSTGIQPRSALGFSTKAILKVMDLQPGLDELTNLANTIEPLELEANFFNHFIFSLNAQ